MGSPTAQSMRSGVGRPLTSRTQLKSLSTFGAKCLLERDGWSIPNRGGRSCRDEVGWA